MVIPQKVREWVRRHHRLYHLIGRIEYAISPPKEDNWDQIYAPKREVIKNYTQKFGARIFIETGTYEGDTVFSLQNYFDKLYSIELDKDLFGEAKKRFANDEKIKILHGDSSKILPILLTEINEKIVFWLDAHYSHRNTALGKKFTPIEEELEAIANHRIKDHIILMDDAKDFNGKFDYPDIEKVRIFSAQKFANHTFEVKDNIIRIVP
jgi:hypothetical protein